MTRMDPEPKARRRWYQFSLCMLLVAVLVTLLGAEGRLSSDERPEDQWGLRVGMTEPEAICALERAGWSFTGGSYRHRNSCLLFERESPRRMLALSFLAGKDAVKRLESWSVVPINRP
jgi:hypothetical protein